MREWCYSTSADDTTSDSKTGAATIPKGMIVDGALALSSRPDGAKQFLVTKEIVSKICPGLVLGDYQLMGVNWMALLSDMTFEEEGTKKLTRVNGVLADEMGLGKTIQTIAFLAWLKHSRKEVDKGYKPHIIIVPASVLNNWKREIMKFSPNMVVVKYHGSHKERQILQRNLPRTFDILLTTFSPFSSSDASDRAFLRRIPFHYMIVDEAHCLKNSKGARYKNMHRLVTERRLLLTGTPIQNSPKELMSLLCFLMPLFGGEDNDGGEEMIQHFVEDGLDEGYQKLKQLLGPFVLRRRKVDVLHQLLPPKVRKVERVPFTDSIRSLYNSIISRSTSGTDKPLAKSKEKHLFTELRKAANHPLLLRTRHTSQEAIDHLSSVLTSCGFFGSDKSLTLSLVHKELDTWCDYDIHCAAFDLIQENPSLRKKLDRYILEEESLFCSAKFTRLRTLLPELIDQDHRILIFSQWTRLLDLLGTLLDTINIRFLRIDGQTDITTRQPLIDEFNSTNEIKVFLLSTRAGGMGINLTSADTCIIHDLDFNPFNDLQAEDRCHRIGQTKKVTVIKMVTEDTVDDDIYKMQERKKKMNAVILQEGQGEPDTVTKQGKGSVDKKDEEKELQSIMQSTMTRYREAEGNK
mmetsp:Transcript_64570/g.76451  ORF Transcript_64570/g.76451 Transcript_64570/m.76451 type:complete len:634 (-) Transcript_64570:75-1976(-)